MFFKHRRHTFRVKLVYKRKPDRAIAWDMWVDVYLKKKPDIVDHRNIKKNMHTIFRNPKFKTLPLSNGWIVAENITYLGWLKKP